MSENKMQAIIGDSYTDNPIVNYLKYWSNAFGKPTHRDDWRRENELDVVWLRGDPHDLHADTIFSLWMPLKMCLQCVAGDVFIRKGNRGIPAKTQEHYDDIIANINSYLPRADPLVKELYRFAELASTRANVMRLPKRRMQSRGVYYFDQMPRTLHECFEGGRFSPYFTNDDGVRDWVTSEKLCMFFAGEITQVNIKPLIPGMQSCESKWLVERNEILRMLIRFNGILLARNIALSIERDKRDKMIPKKMDQQAASEIKFILQNLNINNSRVLIDLEKQTVKAQEEDYSIDDLLEAAGTLTPERGKELLNEVNRSREDWN
ncbi:hypothetical protein [Cohnella sp. GCM10027633]|uniref:hypothetical protein n=1 Tax=unclassified Cohnella TaxID=2636738 RepID=UPI003644BA0A